MARASACLLSLEFEMNGAKEDKAWQSSRGCANSGFVAYLAGGCVRDRILGVAAKDFDIATDARPEVVQSLFANTVAVGAKFGVIAVVIDGDVFEVATFRADAPYLDGRRPSAVHFGTLEADAVRRDFTIGGMYYDPDAGRVIDLVGGRRDLRAGIIRAIGNPRERFAEDRLADAARDPLRGAPEFHYRAGDDGRHPPRRSSDYRGFRRAHRRRTGDDT